MTLRTSRPSGRHAVSAASEIPGSLGADVDSRRAGSPGVITRTQTLVLGFGSLMWISLVVILKVAPDVYAEDLRRLPVDLQMAKAGVLAGVTLLLGLLATGILRRWHWTFWLLTGAFLTGVLRVPVALAELQGTLATTQPAWYVLAQLVVGLVQFALGFVMVAGYRRAGIWGW